MCVCVCVCVCLEGKPKTHTNPHPQHLFHKEADEEARHVAVNAVSAVVGSAPLPVEFQWWPAFLWLQFGTPLDKATMTACVPCERLHLPLPLSPTAVAQMVDHWVMNTPDTITGDSTDSDGFSHAVHRWMNSNQYTGNPKEFLMERIYEVLRRTVDVVGGPRFTRTNTELLRGLIEKHRPSRLSVYAFGMLIRTGDWPSAMRATDHWLGDEHSIGCGAVCVGGHTGLHGPMHSLPFTGPAYCKRLWQTPGRDASTVV